MSNKIKYIKYTVYLYYMNAKIVLVVWIMFQQGQFSSETPGRRTRLLWLLVKSVVFLAWQWPSLAGVREAWGWEAGSGTGRAAQAEAKGKGQGLRARIWWWIWSDKLEMQPCSLWFEQCPPPRPNVCPPRTQNGPSLEMVVSSNQTGDPKSKGTAVLRDRKGSQEMQKMHGDRDQRCVCKPRTVQNPLWPLAAGRDMGWFVFQSLQ